MARVEVPKMTDETRTQEEQIKEDIEKATEESVSRVRDKSCSYVMNDQVLRSLSLVH